MDCFGRDKFSDYRDDMGGVGSFLRQNRTLYVGRMHVSSEENKMEETVSRHFAEWGDIERIRVLNDRGVAFVTYVNEANAQFAKEAMAHQSLDHDEVLNVRWATEDPNPHAQRREKRRLEEQTAEAIKRLLPASYVAEIEGRHKDAKRLKEQEDKQANEARMLEQSAYSEQAEADAEAENDVDDIPAIEDAKPSGIISEDALRDLQQTLALPAPEPIAPKKISLLASAYDSDDDDD
ncbi:Cwc2p [Sugiyamaella lignohabitans]|uniref:Cwc2p n=1 Tax=Sugiyamaella lignohabitans TaxID=796027 RepID=A0A161HIT2_9ASCO|nr:Cwc2p [Sugiyamaella lignohabitans]ANB12487.1 Cwc2p [Sugiyamaella lignohabitans]